MMRCVKGTSGGAWVGVVQALAGCSERCGLPMPVHRSWPISACWAGQSCQKLSNCSLCLQDNGWVEASAGCNCLVRYQGVLCGGAWVPVFPIRMFSAF